MSTEFQNYFTTFLINARFETYISNIRDILQSGIQFGYSPDTEEFVKCYDKEYEYINI
jgi:hypothetical protein